MGTDDKGRKKRKKKLEGSIIDSEFVAKNPGRHGAVTPWDRTLTRFQNCIRYLRMNPEIFGTVLPPGMMLFGLARSHMANSEEVATRVVAAVVVPTHQFENLGVDELFAILNPTAEFVLFVPTTDLPTNDEEGKELIDAFFQNADVQATFTYLMTNNWVVFKKDPQGPGGGLPQTPNRQTRFFYEVNGDPLPPL